MKNSLAISSKVRRLKTGISQWLILGPILLKIFINNLDKGTECTVLALPDDIKFRKMTEILESRTTAQSDCGKLEEWASRNFINSTKTDGKSCTWGGITPRTGTGEGRQGRKTLYRKGLVVLVPL